MLIGIQQRCQFAEALQIAFEGSARVLQMGDALGALVPGRLADIALLRQDGIHVFPRFDPAANLVYSSKSSDVDTVICNGELLMHERKLLTIDKKQVKKEISARLERLRSAYTRQAYRGLSCIGQSVEGLRGDAAGACRHPFCVPAITMLIGDQRKSQG